MDGNHFTVGRAREEAVLEGMVQRCAERLGVAFKVVPMSDGPEPRVGLGFYPSGRLRDVAIRLAYRPSLGLRVISQLPVSEAARWGNAKPKMLYKMRSEAMLAWPADDSAVASLIEEAVSQARRSAR